MKREELLATAYHECGHALVALYSPGTLYPLSLDVASSFFLKKKNLY